MNTRIPARAVTKAIERKICQHSKAIVATLIIAGLFIEGCVVLAKAENHQLFQSDGNTNAYFHLTKKLFRCCTMVKMAIAINAQPQY